MFLALAVEAGAVYVPPDETGILFDKDALPMDADLMRELSGHLAMLAQRPTEDDPARERTTAQLVALASRLDPTNRRAREINRALSAGRDVEPGPRGEASQAAARSWEIAQWLLSEESGPAGQRVGLQLVDVLGTIDPGHPVARNHQAGGESGRWKGVVAPLSRFRGRIEAPKPDPPKPPTPPKPEPTPPPEPQVPAPPIRLAQASLLTPFEVLVARDRRIELVRLEMQVAASQKHEELELRLVPGPPDETALKALQEARSRILGAITREWKRLPEQQLATLESVGNLAYSSRNETAFSGPASLLLASAISGTVLRDDVTFFGDVTPDGKIHSPVFGWRYLAKLREGKGGRLIVPSRLEPQIRSLLAFEEPDFFIRYEVIAVNTLGQALNMAAADPGSPTLVEADAEFARFREITAPASIGPLAVNTHVRERLTRILTANPGHLSAKMILLQGSSWRPTRLDRDTLGMELGRCLDPMAWISGPRMEATALRVGDLAVAYQACHRNLVPLENRVAPSDRDLYAESLAVVEELGSLARLLKNQPGASDELVSPPYDALRTRHLRLVQAIQPPRSDSPEPERKN